jgi:hypothetical protein
MTERDASDAIAVSKFGDLKIKVKQSRYRPGVAQRVPGNKFSQIS